MTNAIRVHTRIESDVLRIPELLALVGKSVEVIVVEDEAIAVARPREHPAEACAPEASAPELPRRPRLGTLRGLVEIPDDFDAPLPEDLLRAFEGDGLLWAASDPERLSQAVRARIEDIGNTRLVSAVSVWEIATKHAIGKLPLRESPEVFTERAVADLSAVELPITARHALLSATLPNHHRGPFDRLLVAQRSSRTRPSSQPITCFRATA